MKKNKMHILSHTHWDREWYQTFQHYRMRLVYQMDKLLELLEAQPEYKCFHLDGQTCCLNDYLEIRPENEQKLKKYISEGRIAIGPWFVMPDELLLSGESLIRNLQLGHKLCDKFGTKPMPVGYATDIFGHISQFPQILKGFHIDAAILHRGTIADDDEKTEMVWEGADGTKILVIKVYRDTGYNDMLAIRLYERNNVEYIKKYEQSKLEKATTNVLFSLEGNDHTPAYADVPKLLEECNERFVDTQCFHSSFSEYLSALKKELGSNWENNLNKLYGELRTPAKAGVWDEVFCGIGSSRFILKQLNDNCEYMLTRYAEPLNAWAAILGNDDNFAFLELAWKFLLLNHPHDSIVGCSIDQVHRDMLDRFEQCKQLAEGVISESIRYISKSIDFKTENDVVTVFNLSSVEKTQFEITVEVATGDLEKNMADGKLPILVDGKGNEYKCEVAQIMFKVRSPNIMHKVEHACTTKQYDVDFARINGTDQIKLVVDDTISPFSFKAYELKFKNYDACVIEGTEFLENEYLYLKINQDATITVLDKVSGKQYDNIAFLEDCGDKGEGWCHFFPEKDTKILSKDNARNVKINYIHGEIKNIANVSFEFNVPLSLNSERNQRVTDQALIKVSTTYTMYKNKKHIECKTVIENTAIEHRVRLLCPTGLKNEYWYGDTAFDCVKRDIKLIDTTGWREQVREDAPIKNFVYLKGENSGFGIVTRGLCEASVCDDQDRTVTITLFRSFVENLNASITKDSQCLGTLAFEYALVFAENLEDMWKATEDYKVNALSFTDIRSIHYIEKEFLPLKSQGQLLNIGELLLSSFRKVNESYELRLYNPFEKEIPLNLETSFNYKEIECINFLGEISELGNIIHPKKVLSLRLR